MALPFAGFMLGWRLPDIVLSRIAARRRLQLEFGMPDALDLLVVCAEAGLSLNQAIDEVSRGLRASNSVVAEEFALTAAEMRVQADVEAVIDNMVRRTGLASLAGIMATLKQSLRFGTPLAESLRLLAAEMRMTRQLRMEERAARLPVLLVIPMMMFILPALLMVIGTPSCSASWIRWVRFSALADVRGSCRDAAGFRQDDRSPGGAPHPRAAAACRHDAVRAGPDSRRRVPAGAQIRARHQPHLGRAPLSHRDRAWHAGRVFLRRGRDNRRAKEIEG